jgi:GT2 family glycosyltransferase
MRLSFIIATWNCLPQIRECLRTIEAMKIQDSEIIVVDAASKDGTAELLRNYPGIICRLLPNKGDWGANNNLGIELSKGDWLCIMNPDIYFNDSFRDVLDVLDSFKDEPYPIVSPQLVFPNGMPQSNVLFMDFATLAKHFTFLGAYLNRLLGSHRLRGNPVDRVRESEQIRIVGKYNVVRLTRHHGRGSLFLIHRSNIQRLGGQLWRPEIRLFAADSDMFRMATEKGIQILSVPSARIVHEEGHATKYQNQTDLFRELSYGIVMFARYWDEHPRVLTALVIADVIFAFLIAPVKRKLFRIDPNHPGYNPQWFLKGYRFRMVAKIRGIIEAWNTPMSMKNVGSE